MDRVQNTDADTLRQKLAEAEAEITYLKKKLLSNQLEFDQHEDHIKKVLLAIRNVNQLIVAEDDPVRLIHKACANLTETLGYHNAWIALMDDAYHEVTATAASGFNGEFAKMSRLLQARTFPTCMQKSLMEDRIIVVPNPHKDCPDCPLSEQYMLRAGLSRRLFHEGRLFGILSVSVPSAYAYDEEEQALFSEVAGDLAFALHKIEANRLWRLGQRDLERSQILAQIGSWRLDLTSHRVFASEEARRIYGLTGSEWTLEQIRVIPLPEYRPILDEAMKRLIQDAVPYDEEFLIQRQSDGAIRNIHSVAEYRAETGTILGTIQDITERREAEKKITLLAQMLDAAPAAITIHDTEGRFLYANSLTARMHGYETEEEFLAVNLHDLDIPESEALLAERFEQIARDGQTRFEVFHHRKDGSTFPLEVLAKSIDWSQGPAVLSIATDITQRKKTETALRESEERNRLLADLTMEGILIHRNGVAIDLNRSLAQMMGYSHDELLSRNFMDFIHPEDQAMVLENIVKPYAPPYVVRIGRSDGTQAFAEIESRNFEQQAHTWRVSAIRDISYRKSLEEQLNQAQKMESVGRLAGGVAHDFNNMLGVILGYSELATEKTSPDQPIFHDLEEIRQAARRSTEITRQLLAFARKQTIAPKVLNLNDTVEGMLKMLRRLIGEDINLIWQLAGDLWPIRMDPSQIDQILANLCVNARDAIDGVGRLTIQTARAVLDESFCALHPTCSAGDYVMISVNDTGCGMDKQTLDKLFEPFFTTKVPGKGTGLGLATVYGIVKQNNGFIEVESKPGLGTTFRIYLTRHTGAEEAPDPGQPEKLPMGNGETILIVEDDPSILALSRTMLVKLNYTVLSAGNLAEAQGFMNPQPSAITLLITDVIMPDMNGRQLAEKLAIHHPGIKTLYMSGYTADIIANQGVLDEGTQFLQKPFSLKEIAHKIREVLVQP
jgi:PAS domain S-box-containing protein